MALVTKDGKVFPIGGQLNLSGFKPEEDFVKIITDKLAGANQLLEKGEIEKGDISYVLSGITGGENAFEKSGKDIRDKLSALASNIKTKMIATMAKIATLKAELEKAGHKPTEKPWYYDDDDSLKDLFKDLMLFTYDFCNPPRVTNTPFDKVSESAPAAGVEVKTGNTSEEGAAKEPEVNYNQMAQNYNNCVREYIDLVRSSNMADVLYRNIDEEKTYKLNLQLLKVLGF